MGLDGVWTLILSCALLALTAGISWLFTLYKTWRVAVGTPAHADVHDWIVVLGKRLIGATVTMEYAGRLRRAKGLYDEQSNARIMVLGGYTSEGPFSEAQQGKNFRVARGVPETAVHTEDDSHHTLENLQNGRQLMAETLQHPLVLVTSRYHLARSATLASGMNLPVTLCAAEDQWQWSGYGFSRLLIESFFLHWYWTGRIWSTITFNRKSLARIS